MLFNHEKQGNPATDDNVDGPSGYSANEESQAEKDKYCMISLICGIKKSQTHRNRV